MKYQHLPNKKYSPLCNAMEEEGWISHPIACCLGDYGGKEKLPALLKRSQTFVAYKAGRKAPMFDNSVAKDMFLVYKDVNGKHSKPVRVNERQSLVCCLNELQTLVKCLKGHKAQFNVGYLDDLKSGLKYKVPARL